MAGDVFEANPIRHFSGDFYWGGYYDERGGENAGKKDHSRISPERGIVLCELPD
jgi:hypothetical protein